MADVSPSPPADLILLVAARIRQFRRRKGVTQDALGGMCGVSAAYISSLERAHCRPTVVTLQRIATALEVPVTSLITEDPAPPAPPPLPPPEPLNLKGTVLAVVVMRPNGCVTAVPTPRVTGTEARRTKVTSPEAER
ncbi:helix-turn-helix protein [Murinocardiopsis flavida]|uniref:Helix-turn-helix protein n=1 Tax=Murinocardiopsis flavida TaxID=645275 RepID=A0A2P8C6W0_9ACTN|nr:helix-turn-helix transcriptional regulator [Murinocardiopsis flavida]PSK80695.1 helix-turn-helix protein [Murinocardiopsis flavida]